ncbi:hypothetical protein K505DRAFT_93884 [Melanomma pulvis-pyrius CBS 109.77]|uniref:Uncharacterized protein n=1 Tax=Melanomma pulvis-pyrius CBS 109.77 TaxID=1314802 RepID=A0A6A6XWJ1_9PLEO|nr:hypothetical protein K505DRAFT_93884 [Melanomma pulvis-pyrius CBS 109.77]
MRSPLGSEKAVRQTHHFVDASPRWLCDCGGDVGFLFPSAFTASFSFLPITFSHLISAFFYPYSAFIVFVVDSLSPRRPFVQSHSSRNRYSRGWHAPMSWQYRWPSRHDVRRRWRGLSWPCARHGRRGQTATQHSERVMPASTDPRLERATSISFSRFAAGCEVYEGLGATRRRGCRATPDGGAGRVEPRHRPTGRHHCTSLSPCIPMQPAYAS